MNEAKRIFSNPRRVLVCLCIPLVCLFFFLFQKCDCVFQYLLPACKEYRQVVEAHHDMSPEEISKDLEFAYSEIESEVKDQADYLLSYGSYLKQVREQADKLQRSSLFGSDPNSFTYRNIVKTARDFADLSGDDVRFGSDRAIRFWLSFSMADWLFLGAILILIMAFLEERQRGLNAIIRSCVGGREKLQLSRLGILAVYSAVMVLLLYYLPLAVSFAIDGGLADLNRPVQSLVEFQKCTASLTLLEFLGQFFLVKTLCGVFLGVLIWFVLSFLNRPQMSWLMAAALLAGEYLLYILIPAQSIFSPLREINVFSYVFTFGFYTQYTNINFFGFPVGRRTLLLWLLVVAVVILGAATVLILTRRYPFGNRDVLGKWVDRWNRLTDRLRQHMGIYGFEVYKLLFLGAGGLFLIVGLLLTQNLICGVRAYSNRVDYVYLQYLDAIEGPVAQDTYDYLATARAALENADMDVTSYEMALDQLDETIENLDDGAWLVTDGYFMDCYGPDASRSQRQNALLSYIFIAACLSPLFTCEENGDIRKVLRSTPGGRQRLFRAKYATALTLCVFVWLRVMCREWALSCNYIGSLVISAPSSSIAMIHNFPTSVWGSLAVLYLFKLVAMLIPVNLCIFIGAHCRGFEKAFIISVLVLLLPAAAYYFGADALAFFTPASLLADWSPVFYSAGGFVMFAVWMVLSILALLEARRSWCKTI